MFRRLVRNSVSILAFLVSNREWFGIDHFAIVYLVTWPLNSSEAEVDLVLIQTSLLLLCKSSCYNAKLC